MSGFYTVDHIYEAKIVRNGRSRKVLSWKYHTRWVGYDEESDTWEPARNFAGGSEHFIDSFWADTDTGGRDHTILKQFAPLEVIQRLHPPPASSPIVEQEEERRSPRVKASKRARSTTSKRKRDAQPRTEDEDEDEAPPAKRARSKKAASASASTRRGRSTKKTQTQTPTPDPLPSASREASTEVPDSEIGRVERARSSSGVGDIESEVAVVEEDTHPPSAVPPRLSRTTPSKLSFRRGEPRVMLDSELAQAVERSESGGGGGKGKGGEVEVEVETKTTTEAVPVPVSAPVPGRASRPMGRRGRVKSKSVRRAQRPSKSENVEVDMQAVSQDASPAPVDAMDLAAHPTPTVEQKEKEKPPISPLAHVSAGFLPSSSTGSSFSFLKNPMPTIWGLVSGFGSSPSTSTHPGDGLFIKAHFQDTQPIHIHVINVTPEDKASVFSSASSVSVRGPDGTFYEEEKAQRLVGSLGSGSAAGVVVLPSDASEEQRVKFDAFKLRLAQGGLFVHASPMVAICSSRNGVMTQRLNVPPCLTNGNEECLVAVAVTIEDPMVYMDVVTASV